MNDKEPQKYLESFLIVDENDINIKNKNISNKININVFNSDSTSVESIYLPFSKKIKKIPYKENSKIISDYKRSESLSRSSSIYIDKKKDEFFNMEFEILDENKIETIKPFKSKCIFYDKKNNSFDGDLIIDKKYICSFIPDKNKKNNLNKLYYNSDYYNFSLFYIKNVNQNTNLLGQRTNNLLC